MRVSWMRGNGYRVIDGPFVEGTEPSDFLTNKTGDAAGEGERLAKLLVRFSSSHDFKVSSSARDIE